MAFLPTFVTSTLQVLQETLIETVSASDLWVNLVYFVFLGRWPTEPMVKALRSCGMAPASDDTALSGGYVGAVRKVQLKPSTDKPNSVVVKSVPESFKARMFAGMFGTSQREARFYKEVADTLPVPIPEVYFSEWSRARGFELIIMENIDGGVLLSDELKNNKDPKGLVSEAMRVAARMHAKYWGATPSTLAKSSLGKYPWLKGYDYIQGRNKGMYQYYKGIISSFWDKVKMAITEGRIGDRQYDVKWSRELVEFIDKAIEDSTWDAYQKYLKTHKHPLTLVHGDYHAGNQLWVETTKKLYTVDWSDVSVGEGPADIAQFCISNVKTDDRRKWEDDLIRVYWNELGAQGVDHSCYPLSMCREAYARGGIDRFVQLLILMAACGVDYPTVLPDAFMQYFVDQVDDFISDHKNYCNSPYLLTITYDAPW
ncbi:hypothetical protein FOL47_009380 [Perkinsus chesapeaki]|uniref:Aminoglycoside phosphotransferase domain-containing protein n=1 Tax=Perkinsus chesapeaki TaxID=330153 RepID=A0A7J6MRX0_PERCH|nr:hypothetical protein FOL47_009380 [Perkinsus chesapeaki]